MNLPCGDVLLPHLSQPLCSWAYNGRHGGLGVVGGFLTTFFRKFQMFRYGPRLLVWPRGQYKESPGGTALFVFLNLDPVS